MGLGTNLKFYTSLSKGLKLKVRKFLGLIPTFVEVKGEKLVGGGGGGLFGPPILKRVKHLSQYFKKFPPQNCYIKKYFSKTFIKKKLPQKKHFQNFYLKNWSLSLQNFLYFKRKRAKLENQKFLIFLPTFFVCWERTFQT